MITRIRVFDKIVVIREYLEFDRIFLFVLLWSVSFYGDEYVVCL